MAEVTNAVLITGRSTGIGQATAEHLAAARAVEDAESAVGVLVNDAGYSQCESR